MAALRLIPATSPELKAQCIVIRKTVFVQEQGYDIDEDKQAEDTVALHFLLADAMNIGAADGEQFVGTARLSARPQNTYVLSRIALLPPFRGGGNGGKLIALLEQWVREQDEESQFVQLEAQDGSYGFYEKLGYTRQTSEPYIKDGKPHLLMRKYLRGKEAY